MNIISKIKPSKQEKIFVEKNIKEFLKQLKKIKFIKPVVGGSISKDTWLNGTKEVDIFACFNYSKFKDKSDKISQILHKELKNLFKVNLVHGSRDYFHVNYNNLIFEIVPILEIKRPEQIRNITDISPLHIKFVNKFPKLKDEIRILKAFCKANFLYGAESYISGFSGYALEVLVIYYKSFNNVLKNSLKWKSKTVIDFYNALKDPFSELNPSKIISPLIVIDPVDKTRNITSSLSLDKFSKFKKISHAYLRKPSEDFFNKNKSIPKEALVILIKPLKGKSDIIYAKVLKAINYIKKEILIRDFIILEDDIFWDEEVTYWFKLKEKFLAEEFVKKGPPENLVNNVIDFKNKYKSVFLKDGIYYTKLKREFTNISDLLNKIIKSVYVKERVKDVQWK